MEQALLCHVRPMDDDGKSSRHGPSICHAMPNISQKQTHFKIPKKQTPYVFDLFLNTIVKSEGKSLKILDCISALKKTKKTQFHKLIINSYDR